MRLDLAYLHMDIAFVSAAVYRHGGAVGAVAEVDEIILVKRRMVYALDLAVQLAEGIFHLILRCRAVNADGDEKRDVFKLQAALYELVDGDLRHGRCRYAARCVRYKYAGGLRALIARDLAERFARYGL